MEDNYYHLICRFLFFRYFARGIVLLFLFTLFYYPAFSQTTETSSTEQQIENITEGNEDVETEDDSYLQQMQQLLKNPVNLNTATETELKELKILTQLQIQNFISYRNLMGGLISVYELQAVPGWGIDVIQKLRPFITVNTSSTLIENINNRLKTGEHSLLVRVTQIAEKSKGYRIDSVANFYPGSPQRILLRYKYQFKNLLQYGVVAEKDAGEQFFKDSQKKGFDFYSAHLFIRNSGNIKSLAIGDFTVNLGQGLTQWQSLAFKKGPDVMNIKREADVLRPYNSAGEIFFHRGAGITLKNKNLEATFFASLKNIDANFITDTIQTTEDYVSSFQTSGFHRTKSEAADKGVQQQLAYGGNLSYRYKNLNLGLNAIQYKFKLPLQKDVAPYNLYALNGSSFGNYSFDYSYTYKNIHLFGEAAINNKANVASVTGILFSAAASVDISMFYRNISQAYQSLYTNAFTENTFPSNEKGFYTGIAIHPGGIWRIEAYADFFKFPWLKFRVDAPSTGADYLLQLTGKPNKQLEFYTRFRSQTKAINQSNNTTVLSALVKQPRQNWRTQVSYKINSTVTLRSRVEIVWFNDGVNDAKEQGFLGYTDVILKPLLKPWAGSLRLQYFETESYNSRVYAFENDVLYSYSIPVFYDKGFRYYLNANYDATQKLTFWFRWAQTIYAGKTLVGSGLDEIKGNKKSEIKLQALYKF